MLSSVTPLVTRPIRAAAHIGLVTNTTYAAFKVFSNLSNLIDVFCAGIVRGVMDGYSDSSRLSRDNMREIQADLGRSTVQFAEVKGGIVKRYNDSVAYWEKKISSFDNKIKTEFMEKVQSEVIRKGAITPRISLPGDVFIASPGLEGIALDVFSKRNLLSDDADELGHNVAKFGNKIQVHSNAIICTASMDLFRLGAYIGRGLGKACESIIGCNEDEKSNARKWSEIAGLTVLRVGVFSLFMVRTLTKLGFSVVHTATCAVMGMFDGLFTGMNTHQALAMKDILQGEDVLANIAIAVTSDMKISFDIAYDNAYKDITGKDDLSMNELLGSNPLNTGKAAQLITRKVYRDIMGKEFFDGSLSKIEAYINGGKAAVCRLSYGAAWGLGVIIRELLLGRVQEEREI